MDTTSNALSRILHLLAQNPSVQDKVRAEVIEAQDGSGSNMDISYDDLVKLPYLDAVCRETLRLYAPVVVTPRLYVFRLLVIMTAVYPDMFSQGCEGHGSAAVDTYPRTR